MHLKFHCILFVKIAIIYSLTSTSAELCLFWDICNMQPLWNELWFSIQTCYKIQASHLHIIVSLGHHDLCLFSIESYLGTLRKYSNACSWHSNIWFSKWACDLENDVGVPEGWKNRYVNTTHFNTQVYKPDQTTEFLADYLFTILSLRSVLRTCNRLVSCIIQLNGSFRSHMPYSYGLVYPSSAHYKIKTS